MSAIYAPNASEIQAVARDATLANPHPDAKGWLLDKLASPPNDWESRALLTVPGVVWTVESDTCCTGRLSAPDNVAYDHLGREFVFRPPANEAELAAIMSADSEEVFACYRFDGLSRWTAAAFGSWCADVDVILGWAKNVLSVESDAEICQGVDQYIEYLSSDAFKSYAIAFQQLLRDDTVTVPRRRDRLRMRRK